MVEPPFMPGLELSRRFYWEAVRPLLDEAYPVLPHAAGQVGSGSDILGFDTPTSMDHDWGPAVLLFLREEDWALAEPIRTRLRDRLPPSFLGFPTSFSTGADGGNSVMRPTDGPPIAHHVWPTTVRRFCRRHLAWEPQGSLTTADWLTLPSQSLRGLTTGAVHHDGVGELTALRRRLAAYPRDVWLYLMAAGWGRLDDEEHLMPRAGSLGDELGSALIGGRLVRDVMSLAFLIERRYAPYPKWFGAAFAELRCAAALTPHLRRAQLAADWRERSRALAEAYALLAGLHNALGITAPLPESVSPFHGRPWSVIHGHRFAAALIAAIEEPALRRLAGQSLIGGIDQFSDSTALRSHPRWRRRLLALYAEEED